MAYWLLGLAIEPLNDPDVNKEVSYSKTNLTSSPSSKVHKDCEAGELEDEGGSLNLNCKDAGTSSGDVQSVFTLQSELIIPVSPVE